MYSRIEENEFFSVKAQETICKAHLEEVLYEYPEYSKAFFLG